MIANFIKDKTQRTDLLEKVQKLLVEEERLDSKLQEHFADAHKLSDEDDKCNFKEKLENIKLLI